MVSLVGGGEGQESVRLLGFVGLFFTHTDRSEEIGNTISLIKA